VEPEGTSAFQVAIAWPIWAGGYPSIDAALGSLQTEHVDELGFDVEFGPGPYEPIDGLSPREQVDNSVVGIARLGPTSTRESLDAESLSAALDAFVQARLPEATRGANIYNVRVERLPLGPSNADEELFVPWIENVCLAAGRSVTDRVRDFARVAGGLHLRRRDLHASDTALLTRSTALLALIQYDASVRAALASAGLDEAALAKELGEPQTDRRVQLTVHPDFAAALHQLLDRRPTRDPIDVPDLAIAIVESARDTSTGLIGDRLHSLRVDADGALAALEALAAAASTSIDIVVYAREVAAQGSRVGGLVEVLTALSLDFSSHDRSVLRRSIDNLYGRPTTNPDHILVGLGAIDSRLRDQLDDAGVWVPLLLAVDPASVVDSDLADLVRSVRVEHGYTSDRAHNVDRLGISGEVNALSDVIVDRDVAPPLAVGLFGRWGSGKSFFMDMMRSRIDAQTRDRLHGQRVLQIRFNAWHYADTSLWASLAVEIFERLADPEPVDAEAYDAWLARKGDPASEQREAILKELETYRTAHAALEAEHRQLVDRRAELVRQRDAAQRQRETIAQTRLRDVTTAVLEQPAVRVQLDRLNDQLHVRPALEELPRMAAELRTTAGYVTALLRHINRPRLLVWLAAVFVVVLACITGLVIRANSLTSGSVAGLVALIAAGASSVTVLARLVRRGAVGVNAVLQVVTETMATVEQETAAQRAQQSADERALRAQLTAHDERIAQATAALAGVDDRIAAADAAVASLSVGRTLYTFLADRAAGYQRHLGIVGMLHRDFLMLDAQLRAFRQTDQAGAGIAGYERIVLYIDDLDRCAPEKVLEVLEAVHLLLALPLFVVVVGVDPRWLKRSLRHSYRKLRDRGRAADDSYLESMPIEYLEKIFQIPFIVPPMTSASFTDLITSLAPTVDAAAVTAPQAPAADAPSEPRDSADSSARPTKAALPMDPGAPATAGVPTAGELLDVDLHGTGARSVDLGAKEIAFAAQLGPLIASPRATKRLMNTYRLLRSTQLVVAGSRLLGDATRPGEHEAILTLLAVAAGFPEEAEDLLVALERTNEVTWPGFVGALSVDLRVAGALRATLPGTTLLDVEPYRRWGPVVARFTFSI
jgi:hypothetical protein